MPHIDPVLIIGVGIAGSIGFLILLIIGFNMWREEARKKAEASGLAPEAQAQKPADAETSTSETKGPSAVQSFLGSFTGANASRTPKASEHEVLRVLRDHLTGRLIVEVAGQRYTKIADIADVNLAQGLVTTVHDLQMFAGALAPATPDPPSRPIPAQAPVEAPIHASPDPAALAAAERLRAASTPSTTAVSPAASGNAKSVSRASELPPIRLPSMNPFKQAQVLRELEKTPPLKLKSMPEQIDEFLQDKILGTPLIRRGIHVSAGPRESVVFELDGKTYASVDDIPDPEVQTVIREAIAEWTQQR